MLFLEYICTVKYRKHCLEAIAICLKHGMKPDLQKIQFKSEWLVKNGYLKCRTVLLVKISRIILFAQAMQFPAKQSNPWYSLKFPEFPRVLAGYL
jgi:hypothetical protein